MEKGDTVVGTGVEIEKYSPVQIKRIYDEYLKISNNYSCAIREVKTKLEILDNDFQLLHKHNPIHHMESRIKGIDSIIKKAKNRNIEISSENICEEILDIAGIRVICHYIEDIYVISELLKNQTDIQLIKEKDYIKYPKPNGYRSLHLVVKIPVFFVDGVKELPVEVQIRTIAMDFWASLEHELRYKSDGVIPKFIADELLECANASHESDLKMQRMHNFLDELDSGKLITNNY